MLKKYVVFRVDKFDNNKIAIVFSVDKFDNNKIAKCNTFM